MWCVRTCTTLINYYIDISNFHQRVHLAKDSSNFGVRWIFASIEFASLLDFRNKFIRNGNWNTIHENLEYSIFFQSILDLQFFSSSEKLSCNNSSELKHLFKKKEIQNGYGFESKWVWFWPICRNCVFICLWLYLLYWLIRLKSMKKNLGSGLIGGYLVAWSCGCSNQIENDEEK